MPTVVPRRGHAWGEHRAFGNSDGYCLDRRLGAPFGGASPEAGRIARGKADSLSPDQTLDEQGLDSYDRTSLLTELEEHDEVELPNDVTNQLKTLNDIVNHLNQREQD